MFNKLFFSLSALVITSTFFVTGVQSQVILRNKTFGVEISTRGEITGFYDQVSKRNYLAIDQPASVLQVKVNGAWEIPVSSRFYPESEDPFAGILFLHFDKSNLDVRIKTLVTNTHIKFELVDAKPNGIIDAVVWGPYPVNINKTMGEIVGVVRNADFAFGLQVLNVKTLGGYPLNEEGSDPSRSNTAKRIEGGSLLQAFSLDRSKPRMINVWWDQFPDMPVAPMKGETVIGSAIALFGCTPD